MNDSLCLSCSSRQKWPFQWKGAKTSTSSDRQQRKCGQERLITYCLQAWQFLVFTTKNLTCNSSALSHLSGKIHGPSDEWKISWHFWAIMQITDSVSIWNHRTSKVIPFNMFKRSRAVVRNGLSLYCHKQS